MAHRVSARGYPSGGSGPPHLAPQMGVLPLVDKENKNIFYILLSFRLKYYIFLGTKIKNSEFYLLREDSQTARPFWTSPPPSLKLSWRKPWPMSSLFSQYPFTLNAVDAFFLMNGVVEQG